MTVHREAYKEERNHVNALIAKTKKVLYNKKIKECNDQNPLFNESVEGLLELFSEHFNTNIANIMTELYTGTSTIGNFSHVEVVAPTTTLNALEDTLSKTQVAKLIQSAPSKSCLLGY